VADAETADADDVFSTRPACPVVTIAVCSPILEVAEAREAGLYLVLI